METSAAMYLAGWAGEGFVGAEGFQGVEDLELEGGVRVFRVLGVLRIWMGFFRVFRIWSVF